jgi:hypothetical protein
MLAGPAELEADLHQHIHKESNVLFFLAVELEATLSRSVVAGEGSTHRTSPRVMKHP